MPIPNLTIIGESINDSVPSTHKFFEANDIAGLKNLAIAQDVGGAGYIDVNVGSRTGEFLAEMVRQVQSVTAKPLAIDTPDPAMSEAGLRAYDSARAGGKMPILNSISELRMEMFELYRIMPFMPILLASERMENGAGQPNHTAEEVYQTALRMVRAAAKHGIPVDQCIIDPAISPIGADTDGRFHCLMGAIRLIHGDSELKGVHMSVGLSNFSVMIPPKRPDGSPSKSPLESAFLTMAVPMGMDFVIGSVKRKYQLLEPDHPAMVCLDDCLKLEGFDVIMRVQEYYTN
ncbi:MAG: dihydropteroate synthase [Akkermansiaceae bacterium]|nr:dihydropteroate synthase [Akkermansiaceae bacterium]MCF7732848.1 dihydropteroate synthase [Akkermansiaceae bacterium]